MKKYYQNMCYVAVKKLFWANIHSTCWALALSLMQILRVSSSLSFYVRFSEHNWPHPLFGFFFWFFLCVCAEDVYT